MRVLKNITVHNGKIISLNRASENFIKSIPFKIYSLPDFSGISEHTHDYTQIWYIMKGCCDHWIGNSSHRLTKGDIFVLPPFVVHEIKVPANEEVNIIGCEFSHKFINENLPLGGCEKSSLFDFAYLEPFLVSTEHVRPRLHLTGKSQAGVEMLMSEMLQEYTEESKYYELSIKADLLKLLSIVAREYEKSSNAENTELFDRYRENVASAIRYVNENYTGKLNIEDICRMAMMSYSYFSHIFKQITGRTFIEYVNNLRICKAMEILECSNTAISDICFEVGFNDITHFNRIFKKEMGLSPRQYRNIHQGK